MSHYLSESEAHEPDASTTIIGDFDVPLLGTHVVHPPLCRAHLDTC